MLYQLSYARLRSAEADLRRGKARQRFATEDSLAILPKKILYAQASYKGLQNLFFYRKLVSVRPQCFHPGRTNQQARCQRARLDDYQKGGSNIGSRIMRDPFTLHDKTPRPLVWGFVFVTSYFTHMSFVGQAITALNL